MPPATADGAHEMVVTPPAVLDCTAAGWSSVRVTDTVVDARADDAPMVFSNHTWSVPLVTSPWVGQEAYQLPDEGGDSVSGDEPRVVPLIVADTVTFEGGAVNQA